MQQHSSLTHQVAVSLSTPSSNALCNNGGENGGHRFCSLQNFLTEEEKERIKKWKEKLEHDNHICPISQALMIDPVILAESGITYERCSIEQWLERNRSCPVTKKKLNGTINQLIPNYSTKNFIEQAKEKFCVKLIKLLEHKLEENQGLDDCLKIINDDLLTFIDRKEKKTTWERVMLLRLRMMIYKRDQEMSGNLQEWFDRLGCEFLEMANLADDSKNITSFDINNLKSVKNLIEILSTKYDTNNTSQYQVIQNNLNLEGKKREEFEYRYKIKQRQRAKDMEERRLRREKEAARNIPNQAHSQQQSEELTTTQWFAMGVGILGAGALLAVGLFSAFSSTKDERRK